MADRQSSFSLSVLGPLEARRGDAPVRLGSRQQRRLLAILAVHANDVVSSDQLIDTLWGAVPPASAAHTLQTLVSRLRTALGRDRIETEPLGYRLRIEPGEIDSLRFEDSVQTGLGLVDRPGEAALVFESGLTLWRGHAYADFADDDFALAEAARLHELRVCAVEERAAALVGSGRPAEVIAALEAEIVAEPYRERLRAVLMTALARAGRPVEALRAFEAFRQQLAEEVGVVPSATLQALNDDIVRQHPDVGWERPSGTGRTVDELPSGTVTFFFTDLEGSTRLWQEHSDAMEEALARHDAILRTAVESQRGRIVKTTGDGVHAVFASARDAIDASIAAQLQLEAESWGQPGPLRVRMGLHSGEASQRDGDYYGPSVNQAARLTALAHGGQIVCSGAVAELVGDHVDLLELGVHRLRDVETPLRVFQVAASGLESRFPPLGSLDASRSNLPHQLTELIGRVDDVIAVTKALAEARVVSIVGVGGAGKTQLALRVGADLAPSFADGVWWCELAALRDPEAVADVVAVAFGYAPPQGVSLADGLAAFFRHKQLLLVLDNCEHLLGGVATFVTAMSREAPRLSVLTTSREALSIHGERTYPLPPLELPADLSPFSVEESAAGALFAARAREARGSFAVTEENAAAIADLCAHLDANPLAIELAAARTAMLSPAEILARLDQRFRLLTGRARDAVARHQTLHAAIDWSYALLDPAEQALLQRLSVFVGDFDLAAATALALDAGLDEFDAVDRLGSLVAKSLVEHGEGASRSRYRLLESIRDYAAEQLGAGGNAARARDAHAAYYVGATRELFGLLDTPRDFEALEQLRLDTPNLAAALRWLRDSERLPEFFAFFADVGWIDPGLVPVAMGDELGRLTDELMSRDGARDLRGYADAAFYAGLRALNGGEWDRYRQLGVAATEADPDSPTSLFLRVGGALTLVELDQALSFANAAVERARRANNPLMLSYMLGLLTLVEMHVEPTQALVHAREAVEVARRSGATSALINPLAMVAASGQQLDPDEALAAAEECIRLDQTHRKAWAAMSAGTAARLRVERGELVTGLERWRDSFHQLDWSGEAFFIAVQLAALADSIAELDATLAVEFAAISASGALAPVPIFESLAGAPRLAHALDELGPSAVDDAKARAAAMSYDESLEYLFDGIDRLIDMAKRQRRATRARGRNLSEPCGWGA